MTLALILPLQVQPTDRELKDALAIRLSLQLQAVEGRDLKIVDPESSAKETRLLMASLALQTCGDRRPLISNLGVDDPQVLLFDVGSQLAWIWRVSGWPSSRRSLFSLFASLFSSATATGVDFLNEAESRFSEWAQDSAIQVLVFSHLAIDTPALESHPQVASWFRQSKIVEEFLPAIASTRDLITVRDSRKLSSGVRLAAGRSGVVLPVKNRRNVLITSALPYVNNVPHLGNIIGCVLSADVYSRYCRLRGYNSIYICGTDEYGTATETKALEENLSCQQICDKYHAIHADVYRWFDIDFDYFGRTSTEKHTRISQDIFKKLNDKGLLLTQTVEQLYSVALEKFLADRFVEGTCPFCSYPDARGDQCDGCGKTFESPVQLINPRCKITGTAPELRKSEHMFLDLKSLQSQCEEFVRVASERGNWTPNGRGITAAWFKEGLRPRCITRDLKWGTPVPIAKMADKVLYVWFDAPIGYLSITANYTDDWERWWKNPDEVELYQFMGKDNVPFHTVIFPCSLIGTGEKYTMLHHLNTTEYLQYEGDKFSKSRGIGVFGNNVMESGIPVEIWRFYLLSGRPETSDSMFTWTELAAKTNNELLANFGNFINRSLKFLKAKYNSVVPDAVVTGEVEIKYTEIIYGLLKEYIKLMEAVKIRAAVQIILDISAAGNSYLQECKLDNTLHEKEPAKCAAVMLMSVNIIFLLSALVEPFMPSTSRMIREQLNVPAQMIPDLFRMDILPGHRIGMPDYLFKRIDDKVVQALFMKYGGANILERREKIASGEVVKKKSRRPPAAAPPQSNIEKEEKKV